MTTLPPILAVLTRSLTTTVGVTTQRCALRGRFRVNIGAGHTLARWENRSHLAREKIRLSPRVI
jgi:hypothetical protein